MKRKDLERLAGIVEQCGDIIRMRLGSLDEWQKELDGLARKRCNGRVVWRGDGGNQKMTIVHSVDAACAVHGKPPKGGRVRKYVGVDKERQEEALEAMRLERRGKDLEGSIAHYEGELSTAYWTLNHFLRDLGVEERKGKLVDLVRR